MAVVECEAHFRRPLSVSPGGRFSAFRGGGRLLRSGRADRGDDDAEHGEELSGGKCLAENEESAERGD